MLFNSIVDMQKLSLFNGLCNNGRALGWAYLKCDAFKGRADKGRGRY